MGSSGNQGRVEVCVDGRWGTICNNNTQIAGTICHRLQLLSKGKFVESMKPGFEATNNNYMQSPV